MSTALANGEASGGNSAAASTGGSALSSADGGSGAGSSGGSSSASTGANGNGTTAGGGSAASGGGEAKSWRDSLPEDMRADPTLNKYSDLTNLAKAHVELQKKIGEKGIIKPGKDASPESWKAFREALGVPAADKYELGKFEGVQFPKESLDWAKKMGAEVGILPEDMTKIMNEYGKFEVALNTQKVKDAKAATDAHLEALKKEWGDSYSGNLQKGFFAFKQLCELGGLDQKEALKWLDAGPGNETTLMKLLAGASKLFGEDKLKEGGVGENKPNPAELDGKISALRQQMISIGSGDGRYPGLMSEFESLNKQKTGGR